MHLTPLLWHLMHRLIPQVAHLRRFGLPQLSRDGQCRGRGSSVTRSQCWLPQVVASSVPTPVVRLPPPAYASAGSVSRTARERDPDDFAPVPAAVVLVREHCATPVGGSSSRHEMDIAPLMSELHCGRELHLAASSTVGCELHCRAPLHHSADAGRLIRELHCRLRARSQRRAGLVLPHRGGQRGSVRRSLRPAPLAQHHDSWSSMVTWFVKVEKVQSYLVSFSLRPRGSS